VSTIADAAVGGLAAAIESLLPDEPDPDVRPAVLVSPRRIAPTGVGGFVGLNEEPEGEIYGRRVDANVLVTVKADDDDELPAAVTAVTRALLTPDRSTLAGEGIQRILLEEMGAARTAGGIASRDLRFAVLYEFLRLPSAPEGVIQTTPLDLDVSVRPRDPRTIVRSAFMGDSLDWFDVVDDAAATQNAPSQWIYAAPQERIEQRTRIGGGSTAASSPNKPGTYLVLKTPKRRAPVSDLIFRALVGSDDDRGIGLVYRYQDAGTFYFFLMHASGGYRLLGKKVNGTFSHLEAQAFDATAGFTVGGTHRLKLVAIGTRHEIYVDGKLALAADDGSITAPGRAGFLSHRNNRSYFYDIDLTEV
jgi:hypothetical protein